jgi:hypothetical protein
MRCGDREEGFIRRVCSTRDRKVLFRKMVLNGQPQKVTALYFKGRTGYLYDVPSTIEHVKFCGNLPRPLGNAKYYLMTDSERVP